MGRVQVVIVRRTMRESSLWQEVTSIPLQAYFLTVGALLTALLLLVNLMLDPSKPESPQPAITDLSKSSGTARTTTGSAQVARSIAPVAPAAQARSELQRHRRWRSPEKSSQRAAARRKRTRRHGQSRRRARGKSRRGATTVPMRDTPAMPDKSRGGQPRPPKEP